MKRLVLTLAALVALLGAAGPASAQLPGGPSGFAQGYGDLTDLIRQLGDVRSLGIDPRVMNQSFPLQGQLGSTSSILGYAQTLNRQIGRLSDLRTLGDPRAEAEIQSILRRHRILGRISEGHAAEQRVRNGVQQHDLKVYYERVAAQARMNAWSSLQEARGYALQKDYDNALAAFARYLYYNVQAREYGGR